MDRNTVAILSHGLWQRRFAGSRDVLGQTLKLNGELYTVVGVMPQDFEFPVRVEIWTSLAMNLEDWHQRGGHYLGGVGRLKDGSSLAAAQADLNTIAARGTAVSGLQRRLGYHPAEPAGIDRRTDQAGDPYAFRRGWLRPADRLREPGEPAALAVAVRRREIGIRNSLGAGRGRLIRQLLTESVLLATSERPQAWCSPGRVCARW